jgi:hypothetical protein
VDEIAYYAHNEEEWDREIGECPDGVAMELLSTIVKMKNPPRVAWVVPIEDHLEKSGV